MAEAREQLGSRLGFLLVAAGCSVGLGNVWRFPFITGQYGGAVFVCAYIFFLLIVGLPILIMEFSVGRASRQNMGRALRTLEPRGTKWRYFGWFSLVGSYALMMFYVPVASWMLSYGVHTAMGELSALDTAGVGAYFGGMLAEPLPMYGWAVFTLITCFAVCALGVVKGVERVVKFMMAGLFIILLALVLRSVTLPGAGEGISFYLAPDMARAEKAGIWNLLSAAMNQAFFTLSIGIGAMTIFGSYLNRKRTLTGEAALIVVLDTLVAIMAGLVIFPASAAFGVDAGAGPGLVFITLPNIFNSMPLGQLWGTLFFVFMSFAAFSTVIAVLENIASYCMDVWGWTRKEAVWRNCAALLVLILPCILGFNAWSGFQPFGEGSNVLDLEDFIISNNLLPLGSLLFLMFCCQRYGWGWKNFISEADTGAGPKFPQFLRGYLTYVLPFVVILLFIQGYLQKF